MTPRHFGHSLHRHAPLIKWRRPLFDIWGVIGFLSCVLSALWTIAIGFGVYMVFR